MVVKYTETADLGKIGGCWPCLTNCGREILIILEPAVEVRGTDSERDYWGVQILLGPCCVGGEEKGQAQ